MVMWPTGHDAAVGADGGEDPAYPDGPDQGQDDVDLRAAGDAQEACGLGRVNLPGFGARRGLGDGLLKLGTRGGLGGLGGLCRGIGLGGVLCIQRRADAGQCDQGGQDHDIKTFHTTSLSLPLKM
jgi:hypothetical protein